MEEEEQDSQEPKREVAPPSVDPLELEVGYGLVNMVDPGDGGGLLHRVGLIREQIAAELGIVIPTVAASCRTCSIEKGAVPYSR